MRGYIFSVLILLMMVSSGCNNPSGGSVIGRGNAPFLQAPAAFSFTQVRAKNGTVDLTWSVAKRVANYKVYMGTSNTTITTEVTSCTGLIQTCTVTGLVPTTTYYFRVDAINDAGTKAINAIAPALSVGSFDITSSSFSNGSITVNWNASSQATNYNIEYGFSPGNFSNIVTNVTSPYTLTGLTNYQIHYFRVVATNAANGYSLSDSEGSETPIGPPSAPTGVSLAATPGNMTLSWNTVSAATSYKIYKGTASGALSLLTTTAGTSYVDNTTTDGTSYFYAVHAANALFDSPQSAEVSARSISSFNMTSVATGSASNQLVISWPATTGAATYDIRYGTNAAALTSTLSNVTSPYTLSGLTGNTTYYFKVVAINAVGVGTSILSTNQLSGIPVPAVAAPTGLIANSTPGQVSLSWNNVSGASSYEVLKGTVSGVYSSLATGVVANTYVDTAVTNGTTYYYVVRSFNGLYSPNSTQVSTKPIQSLSISGITPVSSSSLQIAWTAAAGADAYDVRYGTTSGSYTGTATNVTSPYTLTGLAANTTYYIVISARNAVGTGTIFQSTQSSGQTKTLAPSGLVATTTPGQISLDWANTTGAASYTVYRGTVTGTYASIASGLLTSNYTDTGVTDGTSYFYVVTASNSSESAYSSEVTARSISSFTITGTTSPSPSSIEVTWPVTAGASTYDIRYGTTSGSYTTTLTGRTSPSTISGLSAGTTYYIIVVAKNAVGAGSSLNSNQVSQGTPVGAPVGVLATVGNGQIVISWSPMGGASSYKVYRGTTSGTYSLIGTNIVPTSYTDSTVTDGVPYYYVVKSFNGADSVDSAEVTGKSISAYALTAVTAPSATSVNVTYPATTGGDVYDVRYGTATGVYGTTVTGTTSPTLISGLTANTTYYVVGRARNTVGSGAARQTAEVSVKTPTVAPASLAAVSSPGQVVLTWGAVTGATSYKVYRGTVSGTYSEIANNVATATHTDTGVTNGTTYFYVVRAFNGSDSAASNEISTQPIAGFSVASITSPGSSSIQVSWSAVTGAASYDVRYGTASGSYTTTVAGTTSPYTITGLAANTTYYVVVAAKNAVGAGTTRNSTEASMKTATAAPTALTATASPGQVGLNWTAATGATSYKIYRGIVSGSYTEIASNIATAAYLDTSAVDGTTYFYAVRATNGSDSAYSNEVSIRSIGSFSLTAATAASATSINLTWGAATGAATYDVRYGTASGVYLTTVSGVTSPYILTGLTANTTYYVSIRARNAIGSTAQSDSNELNATTATVAPSALTASSVTGQVNLNWTAATGATSYKVYRGTVSGTHSLIATNVATTTYPDTTVVNGTQYYYVVTATNGSDSANSNEATALPIQAFSIASTTAPSISTVQVTWSATSGAATYDVKYGTVSGTYTTTISSVTSPYTITGLASGTNYFIAVTARNAVGAGGTATTAEVSQVTPIGPPTGLVASATSSAINLSWTAAGGATNYKVLRGTVSGTYTEIANSITGTTHSDTTAVNGTTYFYVVRSFNGADSTNSNEATSRSIASFSIASTSSPTSTSAQVTWGAVTGAASYDIAYGTSTGVYGTTFPAVTSPYTITGLAANTNYYIIVKAKNAVGAGATQDSTESVQKTITATPVGLTASATPGNVGLNWTAVTGATTYNVYRGTTSGSLTFLSAVGSNAYLDTTVTNGTTYFYHVTASNGAESSASSEVSVRPISSFSLTAANSASATSIDLTFGTATGAATYDVRYGTASGVYLTTVSGVTSPYTLTGLTSNTQYFISIRASNAVGTGTNYDSNERNATTGTAAPTALAATATTGQVDLSWTAASGAASYRIYRGTVSGTYSQIGTGIAGTTYTDTTSVNGTQYFYIVRAFNGIESVNSNEATALPMASFSIASTTAPSTSTIQVTWTGPTGATAYDVRYGTTSGTYTTIPNVTSPYTISGLASATNYFIVVQARNIIGLGSSVQTAEVQQVTPLAAPTGLIASAVPGQSNLTWNAVAGASSYKVYRGTTSGSHAEIANNVGTNSYADATAANGTTYYYVVTAFNGADSANSNETLIRPVASVTSVLATTVDATTVQVTWPAITGAASYDIKYGTATGTYTTTLSNQTSPTNITGLSAASTYYIIVEAKNAIGAGTTSTSAETSVTTTFGAPSGLAASSAPGNVTLTWTAIAGASSYKVLRGTVSGTYTEIAGAVGTNTYVDTTAVDGTTYFYVVRAFNGADSANSNEVSTRPISAFTLASVTPASATSLTITFGAATGAASYDVRYGTSSGVYTQTAASVTSPYTLTGLTAGTTYYVSVRAKNAVGAGTNYDSNQLSALTSPAAPAGLAAAATTGQVALTWSAAATATSYEVYRGTATGSYTLLTTVAGTSHTDTTVVNGTTYFYAVKALNGSASAFSNEATAQSIAAFAISATSAPTTSTIQVTWPATTGATVYDVRYGTATGSYTTTVSGVTSPYTISGLSSGTNYFVVVRARNLIGAGSSAQTAEVSQITPIGAPTGLTAASSPASVLLNWTAVSGASSYKVYRGTISGTYSLVGSPATNTYTDGTAANGTTYFYVVKAFNGADSADSAEVSTRPIENFTISSTTSPSSTSVQVNWTAPAGGATYDVRYGTATGSYSTTVTGVTSPYTIAGLTANTNYYIVVRANNAVGAGTTVISSESTQKTASAAPTGLAAVATPGNVALTWTAVSGTTIYKVFRGTTSGSLTEIGTSATASYADTVTNGTTYFYTVLANNGSDSAQSSEISIQSISAFTLTSATPASSTSIDLVWADATGETSYDVRYGTVTGTYTSTLTNVTSPYTISGLTAGTTYYISVKAKNAVGTGTNVDSSNELSAKTSPGAPSAMTAAATTGQVVLNWTAGSGSTNYTVYRGTVSGTYASIGSAGAATTYTDTTVVNGTQYFYVVRGNNGTESANSNEATTQSIAAFSIASTSAPTPSTIQVTWSNPAGSTVYDVRYGTSSGSYTTVAGVSSPYTITGLTGNTTYYIAVRARNVIGSGSSAQTPEVTQITPLSAPTALVATTTTGNISLSWGAVSGATSYKVYRGTVSGTYALISSPATNSYSDSGVTNGTQYFYVVKAFNGSDSADSNEATGLPMATFAITSLTSPSSSSIQATWTGPTGSATFDVRYGTSTGSYATTVTGVTSPYTITGLAAGTVYYVVVRANNAVGSGSSVTSSESSQLTALGAPTGLIASATPGSVGLNWNAQAAATDFKVYRGTTSGSLALLQSNVVTNAYMDTTVTDGVTYYYAVVANNGSDSAQSSEVAIRSISSFSLTAATAASDTSINLTWGPATGAATYDVRYGTSPGVYLTTVSNVTSPYTLSSLTAGTTYYVSIQAKNAVGTGTAYNSNEMNAKTGVGAPAGLAAASTAGTVNLTWTAVTGATNYNIYRSATTGGPYTQIASANVPNSYTDNTAIAGTTYYYIVRTFNGIESVNSSEVFIQPISTLAFTSATPVSSTNVDLVWGAATGAATYDVRYGTVSGTYTSTATNVTSPYTLTGLSPATLYYIAVRANNAVGSGATATSNQLSFTTATGAPTALTAAAASGQIDLSWTAASGATNYRVLRSTTTTGPYTQIASAIATTSYSDTTITNGTQYYYVVRAFNGTESSNSNEATATPIAPFTISATSAPSTTSIQVTWAAAGGASAYDVRYGTTSGSYTTTAAGVTSPYTITGLTANTTYYIIVTARNTIGSGSNASTPQVSQITPVAPPTGLAAAGGTSLVNLTWVAASGATSYKILRGTTTLTYSEIASGVTGTSYTDNTAVNGTTYYYALKSFNGADSLASAEVTSLPISSFSISSVTGTNSTSLSVSWGAATGAASYDLKYGTVSGTYTTTLTGATSPTVISGLTTGTTYYVQMVAKNAVGTGTTVNSVQSSGATNSPPVLGTISNQTVEAPLVVNAPFTLSDSNDVLTCAGAMSGSSSNLTLVPNGNITFSGTMPNCTATVTPVVGQIGTATITVTASDLKDSASTSFDVTFTPCTVASIVWETQPTTIAAGSNWATAPMVSLRKADNSLCTTNTNPVSLSVSIDTSAQQDAAVTGVNPATPSGGYATFSSATMTRAANGYSLNAAQGTITSLDSSTFNVTALAASKVIWAVQPSTANRTSNIIPAPTVRVTDTYGNYIAQNGLSITVSLQDNTEGATLSGTLTRNTDATGAAVFSGLNLNVLGSYILRATPATTYALVDSVPFTVIQLIPQNTVAVMEMLNGSMYYTGNGNTSYPGHGISFGTNNIDGTTSYTWKVVATNLDAQNATLRLKLAGGNISSITVPGNTTVPTLFSTTISNASIPTDGVWSLGSFKGGGTIYSSRIVVQQTNATRTQVYIPLTSVENSAIETLNASTTSTTFTQPNTMNFPTYTWDAAKIARVDSVLLYVGSRASGGSTCVGLFNKTTNTQIGSEICNTSAGDSIVSTSILPGTIPATAELEVRMRNGGAGTAILNRAGLLVRLVSIEKMLAVQRVAPAISALAATANFVEQRASSYISSYGTGAISEYVVCRAKANTAGSGSFVYKNHGTNTSGVASATTITASTINFTSQSAQTTLEAGPVVTVNANNQFMNYTHTSGSFALSHCLMETEVVYP